jgi:hypothetical protein
VRDFFPEDFFLKKIREMFSLSRMFFPKNCDDANSSELRKNISGYERFLPEHFLFEKIRENVRDLFI